MNTSQWRKVYSTVWSSGQFSNLSKDARLTYLGTITLGDDDGRLKGDPRFLKSQIWPYDEELKSSDIKKLIEEIVTNKLLVKYTIDEEEYLYHPKWEKYQHIREDRRQNSRIPPPEFDFSPVTTKRQPKDNHVPTMKSPRVDKIRVEKSREDIHAHEKDQAFASFWGMYPKKIGKKAAWKAWQKVDYTPDMAVIIAKSLQDARNSPGWQNDKGRYIPHASTWINGERWNDEIAPIKPKNTKYDSVNSKTVHG